MAQGEEEYASLSQVKGYVRRKLRRRPPHEENFLNIYPMMDMMTILLVFLIAQFAVDASNITQSAELQIPFSTSQVDHDPAVSLVITSNSITLDVAGESTQQEIIVLTDGLVDPDDKRGGNAGFLIPKLLEALQEHRDLQKQVAEIAGTQFEGEVQIVADKRTPFRTLAETLYTLGQAEFKAIRFIVLR